MMQFTFKFLFVGLLSSYTLFGQEESILIPKGSFKAEVGLSNSVSNVAFRDLMQGISNLSVGYQYTLPNSLSMGIGLKHNYFRVNQYKSNLDLLGGSHFNSVFGKLAYEKYYGQFGLDIGLRAGYNAILSVTNKCQELGENYVLDNSFYLDPVVNLALMVDDKSSFYLNLTYSICNFQFSENLICQDLSVYSEEGLNHMTTYFVIGFGYSYFFLDK